jgi:hypothetical protein
MFLINFQKKPKIEKTNENPKKYVFNIFALFLAFSVSSQKNLNFKDFLNAFNFSRVIFKIIDFPRQSEVDMACF